MESSDSETFIQEKVFWLQVAEKLKPEWGDPTTWTKGQRENFASHLYSSLKSICSKKGNEAKKALCKIDTSENENFSLSISSSLYNYFNGKNIQSRKITKDRMAIFLGYDNADLFIKMNKVKELAELELLKICQSNYTLYETFFNNNLNELERYLRMNSAFNGLDEYISEYRRLNALHLESLKAGDFQSMRIWLGKIINITIKVATSDSTIAKILGRNSLWMKRDFSKYISQLYLNSSSKEFDNLLEELQKSHSISVKEDFLIFINNLNG